MKFSSNRRNLLAAGAGGMLLGPWANAQVQRAATASQDTSKDTYVPRAKYALVIGNRDYPNKKDLPPAHKNVKDMRETLESLDFEVTSHVDLNFQRMREALGAFAAKMRVIEKGALPGSVATLFYFCGNGLQFGGQNYLIPAGIDPRSDGAIKQSFKLIEDIMVTMPRRYPGISIAVIDTSRTDPNEKKGLGDLNPVVAPPGTLLFFATRSGRPALAPLDENRNTFFTESVVSGLRASNGVTPIDDLCQQIANNCRNRVENEFKTKKISLQPQWPESYSDLRGKFIIRKRSG